MRSTDALSAYRVPLRPLISYSLALCPATLALSRYSDHCLNPTDILQRACHPDTLCFSSALSRPLPADRPAPAKPLRSPRPSVRPKAQHAPALSVLLPA